jgi:hypothetical protein
MPSPTAASSDTAARATRTTRRTLAAGACISISRPRNLEEELGGAARAFTETLRTGLLADE